MSTLGNPLHHESMLLRARRALRVYAEVEALLRALPDPTGKLAELDTAMRALGERAWSEEPLRGLPERAPRVLPQINR